MRVAARSVATRILVLICPSISGEGEMLFPSNTEPDRWAMTFLLAGLVMLARLMSSINEINGQI
jgi:hypothetical protein